MKNCLQQRAKLTLHFNLRNKRGETSLIYAVVNCHGIQTKIPTSLFVKPQHWDKKGENVIMSATSTKLEQHNNEVVFNIIYEIKFLFNSFYLYFCNTPELWGERTLVINSLKEKIMEFLKNKGLKVREFKVKNKANENVVEWLIRQIENDNILGNGSKPAYIGKLHMVQKYEVESGTTLSDFTMVNNEWLANYYAWLQKHEERGKRASTKTVNATIEVLLNILRKYAEQERKLCIGYTNTLSVNKLKVDNNKDEIALSDEEVMKIYNYPCEGKLMIVRDLFILACLCGQRISDVGNVIATYKEENGRGKFDIVQKKTTKHVGVETLFLLADEIIKKYEGKKVAVYSDTKEKSNYKDYDIAMSTQSFDKWLKQIAQEAGICGKVPYFHQCCGERTQVSEKERWQCVSSHTGRRTFVTMLALRGWTLNDIMLYTGHENITTLQNCYNKVTVAARSQFKRLPKEKKLQMYEDEETNTNGNNSLDEAYREAMNIEEYKHLLNFIGVDVCEYADLKRDYEFYSLFYKNEGKMLDAGINQDVVKEIWNSQNKTFKEKREALQQLVADVKRLQS